MTDREEHNAEIDADYWSDDETFEMHISNENALQWLMCIGDGEAPEEIMEFLQDALDAIEENEKCTVSVLAANYADKHEREIKEYLK